MGLDLYPRNQAVAWDDPYKEPEGARSEGCFEMNWSGSRFLQAELKARTGEDFYENGWRGLNDGDLVPAKACRRMGMRLLASLEGSPPESPFDLRLLRGFGQFLVGCSGCRCY